MFESLHSVLQLCFHHHLEHILKILAIPLNKNNIKAMPILNEIQLISTTIKRTIKNYKSWFSDETDNKFLSKDFLMYLKTTSHFGTERFFMHFDVFGSIYLVGLLN